MFFQIFFLIFLGIFGVILFYRVALHFKASEIYQIGHNRFRYFYRGLTDVPDRFCNHLYNLSIQKHNKIAAN